jgi:hypothetical protein
MSIALGEEHQELARRAMGRTQFVRAALTTALRPSG